MVLVKEVMRTSYKKLSPSDGIKKAADLLLKIPESAVPVIDKGKIVGEVHQKDFLLPLLAAETDEVLGPQGLKELLRRNAKKVGGIMRPIAESVEPEDTVQIAAKIMYEEDCTQLPVIKNGKLLGVINEIDIIKRMKKSWK